MIGNNATEEVSGKRTRFICPGGLPNWISFPAYRDCSALLETLLSFLTSSSREIKKKKKKKEQKYV